MMMMNEIQLFANLTIMFGSDFFFCLATLIIFTYAVIVSTAKLSNYTISNKICIWLMILFSCLCISLYFYCFILLKNNNLELFNCEKIIYTYKNIFYLTNFLVIFKNLLIVLTILILLLSMDYVDWEKMTRFEYPILLGFATIGMIIMLSANDFTSLFLSIELQNIALYILISFSRNKAAVEASIKYFILAALVSLFLSIGLSKLYFIFGTMNIDIMHFFIDFLIINTAGTQMVLYHSGIYIAIFCIIIAIFFKSTIAPSHSWAADVYEGAPIPITLFLIISSKLAFSILLLKLFFEKKSVFFFLEIYPNFSIFFLSCIFLSLFLGSFSALTSVKLKRLLAYSSISHMGLILLILIIYSYIDYAIFYIVVYIIMSTSIFFHIANIRHIIDNSKIGFLEEIHSIREHSPLLSITLAFTLFSFAGIPPLAGFWSKYFILEQLIFLHEYILAFIIIGFSMISAYYYIRIVKIMYTDFSDLSGIVVKISLYNYSVIMGCTLLIFGVIWFCNIQDLYTLNLLGLFFVSNKSALVKLQYVRFFHTYGRKDNSTVYLIYSLFIVLLVFIVIFNYYYIMKKAFDLITITILGNIIYYISLNFSLSFTLLRGIYIYSTYSAFSPEALKFESKVCKFVWFFFCIEFILGLLIGYKYIPRGILTKVIFTLMGFSHLPAIILSIFAAIKNRYKRS